MFFNWLQLFFQGWFSRVQEPDPAGVHQQNSRTQANAEGGLADGAESEGTQNHYTGLEHTVVLKKITQVAEL